MNLRIYYFHKDYTDQAPCFLTNNTGQGICKTIWDGMVGAQPEMSKDDFVEYGIHRWSADSQELQSLGVQNGGVVIFDADQNLALVKLSPSEVTTANITKALKEIWPFEYNEPNGLYVDENGDIINPLGSTAFLNFPGLGLFNLNFNLPKFVWWIVAGASAWQANTSRTKIGRYGFGALTIISAGNALNKK